MATIRSHGTQTPHILRRGLMTVWRRCKKVINPSYICTHGTADFEQQQSPYSLTQSIRWHLESMALGLLHVLKICTACKTSMRTAPSGILPTCRITKAVFLQRPASGAPDHQMRVRGCIGSGIPAGMICTKTSAIGRDACTVNPTSWSRRR